MAATVPESWLEWDLGTEEDTALRPLEIGMLAVRDARTTAPLKRNNSCKIGKPENWDRHVPHAAALDQLSETASPPEPGNQVGGIYI